MLPQPDFRTQFRTPVIAHFATPCLASVGPSATAREALRLMETEGVRYLPVRRAQRVVGILKDSVVKAAVAGGHERRVGELMIRNPSVLAPETSLFEALDALPESAGGCQVLQADSGTITGLFTGEDAIRAFHSLLATSALSWRGSRRRYPRRS